ncbi:uncharacterized protein BO88DRAFT_427360 [Aspergillus vadensis CBS 113365]|uniref:Xylanolytic transcriptional activator regulatory domain-containing protein n=1 Tax=Aspergillus vadensis (strain CBS 113365 / IMI 142717 / IBT 24658) TaxID=1448311 RepID=A0A319BUH2_ASPVC|nr:hypothetical protein BO88DRAFT_427360 [Aspergillus vadensis CBS 113365]PYH66748.1 hypothetical protein BO88DRAFT_427360 [Aspergillus vadensis CBS 113365]
MESRTAMKRASDSEADPPPTLKKGRMCVLPAGRCTPEGMNTEPKLLPCALTIASDVLRRHLKSHEKHSQNASPQPRASISGTPSRSVAEESTIISTPSHAAPRIHELLNDASLIVPAVPDQLISSTEPLQPQSATGMNLHDSVLQTDTDSWFLGADFDVNALDFSISSAISEWAQLPSTPHMLGSVGLAEEPLHSAPTSYAKGNGDESHPADIVRKRWFTCLSPPDVNQFVYRGPNRPSDSFPQGRIDADDNYRAGLSQRLKPRMHDEALPSAEQLNLFAKLFFSRFHSLFPVIHAPTFRPTAENSLLFLSICSIGSLFVGSSHAVAQGLRIFERLNKAILASWESILAHSRPDALSMVQAAILGQTYGILSGRPKDLVLADVLHGTVMGWTRESNKYATLGHGHFLDSCSTEQELIEQWHRWAEAEQRRRVEIALNIHDAELASLMHHEPIRKHRFTQYPLLASESMFMAPTAARWANIYKESPSFTRLSPTLDHHFHSAGIDSRFAVYSVLESINAHVIEARLSGTLNRGTSQDLSSLLMHWWSKYSSQYIQDEEEDPFSLPVLWHSIYMSLYSDMDVLERAVGRNGHAAATESHHAVQGWAGSLDASKCLVHALLIQRYLERMRISSEPAIHVPGALFSAALAWLCFTRIGRQQSINLKAFDAPEIQLLGSETALQEAQGQAFGDSAFADVNHLHRLIDLLHRFGRWTISKTFATVLCTALEEVREE